MKWFSFNWNKKYTMCFVKQILYLPIFQLYVLDQVQKHSEKRFDWIEENNLIKRFFFIQTKDLFQLNHIFSIKQNIFGSNEYLFKSNQFWFKTSKLLHMYMVKEIVWVRAEIYLIWTNFINIKIIIFLNYRKSFKQKIFSDSIKFFFWMNL